MSSEGLIEAIQKLGSVTCVIRMLKALAVYGYRSLCDLIVPLDSLNLVTLTKAFGETVMAVQPDDVRVWQWPTR